MLAKVPSVVKDKSADDKDKSDAIKEKASGNVKSKKSTVVKDKALKVQALS